MAFFVSTGLSVPKRVSPREINMMTNTKPDSWCAKSRLRNGGLVLDFLGAGFAVVTVRLDQLSWSW